MRTFRLLAITAASLALMASPPTLPAEAKGAWETAVGTLKGVYQVEQGAKVRIDGGNLVIVQGFFVVAKGEAYPVPKAGLYVLPFRYSGTGDLQITLVQDKATGQWLVTDGRIAVTEHKKGFVEGHQIRIIGEQEDLVKIDGMPFSNGTFKIRQGKPVKLTK